MNVVKPLPESADKVIGVEHEGWNASSHVSQWFIDWLYPRVRQQLQRSHANGEAPVGISAYGGGGCCLCLCVSTRHMLRCAQLNRERLGSEVGGC